jgi:3-hydroxybenzoate 6-monooxygenase
MTGPPMIIAGGGIAGLSTAIAVAAAGNRVLVLERASGFAEMGAGIQLGPNAFHALRHLGIHDVLGARAVLIDELRLMDGTTGRCITTVPLGEAVQVRYAHPYAVVHRGDLYQALLDVARGHDAIELREGHPVRSYEQHPAGVTVALDDGRTLDGTALIGADGLHSVVRAQLLGDGDPCPVGHVTYRALVPADRMPADVR